MIYSFTKRCVLSTMVLFSVHVSSAPAQAVVPGEPNQVASGFVPGEAATFIERGGRKWAEGFIGRVAQTLNREEELIRDKLAQSVEQIQKDCDLSPLQAARLRIAAKGAFQYYARPRRDRMTRIQAEFSEATDNRDITKLVERAATISPNSGIFDPFSLMTAGFGPGIGTPPRVPQSAVNAIERHPLWTAALENVLTPEQIAAHRTARVVRISEKRQQWTDRILEVLTSRLSLDAEQRTRMSALVDAALAKDENFLANVVAPNRDGQPPYRVEWVTLKGIDYGALEQFLTDAQLEQWAKSANERNGRTPVVPNQRNGRNKKKPKQEQSSETE